MDIYIVYIYIRYIVPTHSAHTQIHTNMDGQMDRGLVGRKEALMDGQRDGYIKINKIIVYIHSIHTQCNTLMRTQYIYIVYTQSAHA